MNPIDLLIQNALVFDGNGNEPHLQDVAMHQGLIHEVGPALKLQANQTIDAQGLALMPGIIDSHTHYDAQITWDPYVNPSPLLELPPPLLETVVSLLRPANQSIAK